MSLLVVLRDVAIAVVLAVVIAFLVTKALIHEDNRKGRP